MYAWANSFYTTLTADIDAAAISISVASLGDLTLAAGKVAMVTLQKADLSAYEIVKVTAISGLVLTVERAQEGTTAQAWLANDIALAGSTKVQMSSFQLKIEKWHEEVVSGTYAITSANGYKQALQASASVTLSVDMQDGEDMTIEVNPQSFTVTLPVLSMRGGAVGWQADKWHTLVFSRRGNMIICWWEVEP